MPDTPGLEVADTGENVDAPDTTPASPNVPGSRLELRYQVLRMSDGAFYDRQLDVDCSFRTAKDGKQRCLPLGEGVALIYSSTLFADSGCTEALISLQACAVARRWATRTDGTECLYPTLAFAVGSKYTGQAYVKSTTGACTPTLPVDAVVYYRVVRELEPNEFVSAEYTTETSSL